jgi:hypothetical protein
MALIAEGHPVPSNRFLAHIAFIGLGAADCRSNPQLRQARISEDEQRGCRRLLRLGGGGRVGSAASAGGVSLRFRVSFRAAAGALIIRILLNHLVPIPASPLFGG